jgi:hypothetical protein
LRPYEIYEALNTMSVPISSINHIKVGIYDERDFRALERLSNRTKSVDLILYCIIQEIYEPN